MIWSVLDTASVPGCLFRWLCLPRVEMPGNHRGELHLLEGMHSCCMHAHPGCLFVQPGVSLQKPRCDEDGAGRQSRTTTSVSSLQSRKSKRLLELPGRQRYQQGG